MGTRSSTGFIHKEKYTGVYNQFDGYLGGVGKDVVKVLRALLRPDRDAEDPKKSIQEKLAIMKERLSAVKAVTNETPPTEEEQRMYMEAGFCDTDRLEIYKGFQKQPQEGNVFGTESDRDYFPCAKVIEFPLLDIPGDWMEQAEKAMGIEE